MVLFCSNFCLISQHLTILPRSSIHKTMIILSKTNNATTAIEKVCSCCCIVSRNFFATSPNTRWGVIFRFARKLADLAWFCCNDNLYLDDLRVWLKWVSKKAHWSKYPLNHCIPLLLFSWGQVGCQMKRKSTRNSIFLVSAANFQLELNNLQKRPKYVSKCHFWEGFSKFIQLWLKISGSNPKTQVPWSFSLHLTPCLTPGAQK